MPKANKNNIDNIANVPVASLAATLANRSAKFKVPVRQKDRWQFYLAVIAAFAAMVGSGFLLFDIIIEGPQSLIMSG